MSSRFKDIYTEEFYKNVDNKLNKTLKYIGNFKESLRINETNKKAYMKFLRDSYKNWHSQVDKSVKPISQMGRLKQKITTFKMGNDTISFENWRNLDSDKRLKSINDPELIIQELNQLYMIYITSQGERDLYTRTERYIEKFLPFHKRYALDVILKGRSFKMNPLSMPKSFHSGNTILENILGINAILSVFTKYDCRKIVKMIKGSKLKDESEFQNCHANSLNTLVSALDNMRVSKKFNYNHILKISEMSHIEKIKLFRDMHKFLQGFIVNIPPLEKDYIVYFEFNVGYSKLSSDFLKKKLLKENNVQWIIDPDESKMMNKLSYTYLPESLQLGKSTYDIIYKMLLKNFRGESDAFVRYITETMQYTYTFGFEEEELLRGNSGPKIRPINNSEVSSIKLDNIKGNLIRLRIPAGTKVLPYKFSVWKSTFGTIPNLDNKKVFLIPPGFEYQISQNRDIIKYRPDGKLTFSHYRVFDVEMSVNSSDRLSNKIELSRQMLEKGLEQEERVLETVQTGGESKKKTTDPKKKRQI